MVHPPRKMEAHARHERMRGGRAAHGRMAWLVCVIVFAIVARQVGPTGNGMDATEGAVRAPGQLITAGDREIASERDAKPGPDIRTTQSAGGKDAIGNRP